MKKSKKLAFLLVLVMLASVLPLYLGFNSSEGGAVAVVYASTPAAISPSSSSLVPGQTQQLSVNWASSDLRSLTWTSSNTHVATVGHTSGLVTARNHGWATITAHLIFANGTSTSATASISVSGHWHGDWWWRHGGWCGNRWWDGFRWRTDGWCGRCSWSHGHWGWHDGWHDGWWRHGHHHRWWDGTRWVYDTTIWWDGVQWRSTADWRGNRWWDGTRWRYDTAWSGNRWWDGVRWRYDTTWHGNRWWDGVRWRYTGGPGLPPLQQRDRTTEAVAAAVPAAAPLPAVAADAPPPGNDDGLGRGGAVSGAGASLRFTIGSIFMRGEGMMVTLEAPPFIDRDTNRTMVPLRAVAEGLGAGIDWNPGARTATIERDGTVITLPVDAPLPGGMGVPMIVDGRTFVPIRYVSEVLGEIVRWDGNNMAVYVN